MSHPERRPTRHLPVSLGVAGILAYGAAFAWYMLAQCDLVNLIRNLNLDDSFYYFQIARNLAAGEFSTFDGGITRTNGYHPLWLLLITPFYWFFDAEGALFAIKAFEIMLIAGGCALIVVAARVCGLPWVLLLVLPPIIYREPALFAGLEAAAAFFMLGLFFLVLCLYGRDPGRWRWPLAVVAFSLPWVRLEFMAISVAATAALWILEREGESLWSPKRALLPMSGACLGILVYFAYNQLVFDGMVPVSGATKRAMSQAYWEAREGYSFLGNLWEVLRLSQMWQGLLLSLVICLYTLLIWWFVRRTRDREGWLFLFFLIGASSLALGHAAKFVQTALTVIPAYGDYSWYFVPMYLMMALIVPVSGWVAIYFSRRLAGPKSLRVAQLSALGAVLLIAGYLAMAPFRHVDEAGKSSHREWEVTSYLGVRVMDRVLPEDSVIGSFDSGAVGYFSKFPVVNLDGLVNSYDYLRIGRMTGNLAPFHRKFGITHFANVNRIDKYLNGLIFEGPSFEKAGKDLVFFIWRPPGSVTPVEASGEKIDPGAWFWERMAPHFDYRSDDLGVVVDGLFAQLFIKGCEPQRLRNTRFAFSWTVEETGETAETSFFWRNPRRNSLNLCVEAFYPPADAILNRVETMPGRAYFNGLLGDLEPVIRSRFDVYLKDVALIYVNDRCDLSNTDEKFFLHLIPTNVTDLPMSRWPRGFDGLDFDFGDRGLFFAGGAPSRSPAAGADGQCIAEVELPEYGIERIRTGQYTPGEGRIWGEGFDYPIQEGGP